MAYWQWLRGNLKSEIIGGLRETKWIMRNAHFHFYIGFLLLISSLAFGIPYGFSVDPRFFLLLLGVIPAFLLMTHARYRMHRDELGGK